MASADPTVLQQLFTGLTDLWTLVGPVVGGVVGAMLTVRHQRRLEVERQTAAREAEQRAATRDLYIDTLRFVAGYREARKGFAARIFGDRHRMENHGSFGLTREAAGEKSLELSRKISVQLDDLRRELSEYTLLVRSMGSPDVARALDEVMDSFMSDDGKAEQMFVVTVENWERLDTAIDHLVNAVADAVGVPEAQI